MDDEASVIPESRSCMLSRVLKSPPTITLLSYNTFSLHHFVAVIKILVSQLHLLERIN